MTQSIDHILTTAHIAGASDVHITIGVPPKMRVNGSLTSMEGDILSPMDTLEMAHHIMNKKQKELFEEVGELDTSYEIAGVGRFRVNIFKQRGSVAMAFRLVSEEIPSPEDLGLPQSVVDLYQKKRGLILVTGPTGSGKSTTLAALVDRINKKREAHIITLEEPIEYVHQHKKSIVNQREGKTHQHINVIQTGRHDGMITMDDALVQLYDECRIDRDTAIQYSQDPKSIMNKLF